MSSPSASFSMRAPVNMLPLATRVLAQTDLSSVLENTVFCIAFMRSATAGFCCAASDVGQ